MLSSSERGSTVGDALRNRRKQLGVTQQDLADLASVSARFIHELESGKSTVRLDKVEQAARVLGLKIALVPRASTDADMDHQ
jgi:y4mF family transcriptional regulator